MSLSPLALSVERRKRHPYRSLYAEMLFQSFRDALAETRKEATSTVQELVEGSPSAQSEEERTGRNSKRKQHTPEAQLPVNSCLQ